ncbi:MAG: hypothetical protein ACE5IJ_01655 [Thermoplasmata archaeon]
MGAVKEYIFERHEFPSVSQLSDLTGIPRKRCKERCEQLARQNQLYKVFGGGKGLPPVFILYDMMQQMLRVQARPKWMMNPDYTFPAKKELDAKISHLRDEVNHYEMIERLLYTGDVPLEEAVAYALEWLGFKNVVHHKDDPDNPDVTFEVGGKDILAEVEGTTKAGDKEKILQLDGWIRRAISNGAGHDSLQGLFIVNHYRDDPPDKRSDPLTPHAKEFLSHYGFRFVTTHKLFRLVGDVLDDKMSKKKAREAIIEGERIGQR